MILLHVIIGGVHVFLVPLTTDLDIGFVKSSGEAEKMIVYLLKVPIEVHPKDG